MPMVSPWDNESISPLRAAGALIPIALARTATKESIPFANQLHGTGFFISRNGTFLTAAHVIESFPNDDPALGIAIMNVNGLTIMPVRKITRHPTLDVALGFARVSPDQLAQPCPLVLSERRLQPDAGVAILGYPRTQTDYRVDDVGDVLCRFTFTPDFFAGAVLDHHPDGFGLAARGPAYSTNIVPPPQLRDFSGISGGPLVARDSIDVHGVVCSASESYAVCTDVAAILDWMVFDHDVIGSMSLREAARHESFAMTVSCR